MFRISTLGLSALALIAATPAMAQEPAPATDAQGTVAEGYVGLSGGYHDLGTSGPGDDGGFLIGGVAGFDVPLGTGGVFIGAEGNAHYGTDAIDYEYGVAGRIGYKFPSGGKVYARGGYQWVNIDIANFVGLDVDEDDLDISDTDGDYLLGVGGEFPVSSFGGKARIRVGVDTVSFDTIRPNASLIIGF